jgi:hypothetical protein
VTLVGAISDIVVPALPPQTRGHGGPDFGETEQWVGCRRRCMDFRSRPEPVVTLAMRFVRVLALTSSVR